MPARFHEDCPACPEPRPFARAGQVAARFACLLAVTVAILVAGKCGAAEESPAQSLRKLADGFVSPVVVVSLDAHRLLVVDQIGLVSLVAEDGAKRPEPFLDVQTRLTKLNNGFDERGLLGLALHPRFVENRKVYAYYSAPLRQSCPTNWDHTSHLSEFTASPDGGRVDIASEKLLLEIDEPYSNHNGGRIAFGPDGCLYIGMGDGGNGNDEGHDRSLVGNAQDLTTHLGKILRIDVDHPDAGRAYGIPKSNPLVGRAHARPEIFAWGIRNPWGMSFDQGGDHELFAADVGQNRYEEVNIIRLGGNYGWNQREGHHPFDRKNPGKLDDSEVATPSDRSGFLEPILEYKNLNAFPKDPGAMGISITGGHIYRGRALPHLQGRYVFGDWTRQWVQPDGRLLVATRPKEAATGEWTLDPLPVASHPESKLGAYVLALGQDMDGEIYVLTSQRAGLLDRTGAVWKLVPAK